MGQGASLATFADPLLQRQSSRRSTSDGKRWQENPRCGPRNLGHTRGFIVSVFPFRNRVSVKEAIEGLELGEGKPSRPVLRGPGGRKAAWLLGMWLLRFRRGDKEMGNLSFSPA